MRGDQMKRRWIIVFVLISSIVTLFLYLQFGRDVKVSSSRSQMADNYYEENLTVVANTIIIADKQAFAEELIQRCIDNNFHEILFSYDIAGYPNRLQISVYPNEWSRKFSLDHFTILYQTDAGCSSLYNIKDNPDMYEIIIENE